MSNSVEVICDGTLFATLISEDLPAAHAGRKASDGSTEIMEATADFPSAPTQPKKRRSRKKEVIEEI